MAREFVANRELHRFAQYHGCAVRIHGNCEHCAGVPIGRVASERSAGLDLLDDRSVIVYVIHVSVVARLPCRGHEHSAGTNDDFVNLCSTAIKPFRDDSLMWRLYPDEEVYFHRKGTVFAGVMTNWLVHDQQR